MPWVEDPDRCSAVSGVLGGLWGNLQRSSALTCGVAACPWKGSADAAFPCGLRRQEEALRCFFHPRELASKSKWFCEACGTKTRGSQVLRMTHLPQTLTLHLMRFSIRNSQTEKVCHLLHFPQRLDLSQVLLAEHQDFTEDAEQREAQYELFAVIAHVGMADVGHYCAYIRNPADGRWLCFNDSNVCWVSWEDVQCAYGNHHYRWQETAYLLVYMKIRG
ncbi:ubl carboxyl-terminal hydrolase 18-like [Dipodomys spectabilis]|uniref:ubl carboxyl-terminal hydrolase 18-like n=1 Tax=Dipodomys spectabilis TaxID=105255 RepID=UPI001C545AEE|nr:ubl carboxyl-terminal hydrolase 18-like [Dipodomys spectabilis]